MELRFVALALRKLWWLIALFAVFGIILARSLCGPSTGQYQSQALLLVRPSSSSVSPALASQPDRYVLSQISVLESTALAESVANMLGGDETPLTVRRSSDFVQRDETDIVVEFCMEVLPGADGTALGEGYLALYTMLWDEDEAMMIERAGALGVSAALSGSFDLGAYAL